MPRKVNSAGISTQEKKTSDKRARGVKGANGTDSPVPDGGKWAGSGRKTVEHSQGPEIARQSQTGRGAKTRVAVRTGKANHPNHG